MPNNPYESNFKVITENRLNSLDIWWKERPNYKNQIAKGCIQAASVRDRLGSGEFHGVPLWTEFKSKIGIFVDSKTGKEHYYAAHSRGNCRFVVEKIATAMKIDFSLCEHISFLDDGKQVDSETTKLVESKIFGIVNPFNLEVLFKSLGYSIAYEDITQIFDASLEISEGYPQTVTTNIGDRAIAIEFRPDDLISIICNIIKTSITAEVSIPDPIWLGLEGEHKKDYWAAFPPATGPKIGILTGNSPESGLTLWQDLLAVYRNCYNRTADVLMPEVMIDSLPQMGLTMELVDREEYVWTHIEEAIDNLLKAGCKLITVACNTTIYFEPKINEMCEPYGARFVSIAEACIPAIKAKLSESDASKVGIVGIGPVINMEEDYSGYERHFNQNSILPVPFDGTDIAYDIKNAGTDNSKINKAVNKFRRLVKEHIGDTEIIVLALTEVSLAFRRHKETANKKGGGFDNYIDPLEELTRYLVYLYAVDGYKQSKICQIPDSFPIEQRVKDLFEKRLGKM